MRCSLRYLWVSFVSIAGLFAQNQPGKLKMPGPDVQNLMLGTWSTQIRYAPTPEMPNGGTGEGTEIWRPGPGGLSVIEEEHEKNAKGEIDGFSIGWWDEKAGGQRFIWCANDVPQGCVVPNDVAKWEGERLVLREDKEQGGRKITHAEIFSDITPDSFTQLLQEGETGKALTTTVTILAKRKTELSAVPEDKLQASGANSKPEMQTLAHLLSGRWSGKLLAEPGSREVGRADEVWHISPGGLTLTEENRLSTSKGDSYDFAAIWWNPKAKKYEGIWCADINDEGCNGFEAKLQSNQVTLSGEWEQSGKRRAWHEVLLRPNDTESIQTLDVGETGGEMKRVSAIHASRIQGSIADAGSGIDTEQGFRSQDKNSEAAKLLTLSNDWTDAINSGNRQKLDALMASDFALYHWNGDLAAPRLQWLDNLFNHIKIRKNTLTDSAPQLYSDVGVVTSVGDWIGSFDGKPFSQKCVVVDTWRKIDDQWKVVRRTSHCYAEDSASGRVNWSF